MSDYRPDAIYVRHITRKALYYIPLQADQTIDALCDDIIYEWLCEIHPDVIKHLSDQADRDKAFKDKYKQVPFT